MNFAKFLRTHFLAEHLRQLLLPFIEKYVLRQLLLPFIEKYVCLAILCQSSKMALVGFQHEPVSLDVNEVCFEEEQDIPNAREKSRKILSVKGWCRCGR